MAERFHVWRTLSDVRALIFKPTHVGDQPKLFTFRANGKGGDGRACVCSSLWLRTAQGCPPLEWNSRSWGWGERRTWKQTDQSGNFQQAFSQGRSVVSECHMYSCFPRVRRQGKVYEAALLQVGKLSHVQTGFPPTQSGCLRTSLRVPGPFRPRQDPASRQAWRLPGQRPQGPRPFSLWPKRTR